MVAPSFQKMEMLGEPFEANGKMYIQIRNPKTGNKRQVRWYNEKEYQHLYPESAVKVDHSNDPYWKPQKIALGFEKVILLSSKVIWQKRKSGLEPLSAVILAGGVGMCLLLRRCLPICLLALSL